MKASAYLSIFDDWEILETALESIEPHVEEIVVVDGAYRWLADIIGRNGRDPTRSVDAVQAILRRFAPKLRVINGLWENELQKRIAGYEACQHRYIYRLDADEVLFLHDSHLRRFIDSPYAVAETEIPLYTAPGLIRATSPDSPIERLAILFDRTVIDGPTHLNHLWLLLPPDEDAVRQPPDRTLVYPDPIAFIAHLTHWRSPASAINRARFYVINYIRGTGDVAWLAPFRQTPDEPLEATLARFDPQLADDFLLGHAIVAEPPDLQGFVLRPSPLSAAQEQAFAHHYTNLLSGLAQTNARLSTEKRHIVCGNAFNIDISTQAARAPFLQSGPFRLNFETPIRKVQATLVATDHHGRQKTSDLPAETTGASATLDLPPNPFPLRQTLKLTVWNQDFSMFNRVWAG